jgi:hypothetical protein
MVVAFEIMFVYILNLWIPLAEAQGPLVTLNFFVSFTIGSQFA